MLLFSHISKPNYLFVFRVDMCVTYHSCLSLICYLVVLCVPHILLMTLKSYQLCITTFCGRFIVFGRMTGWDVLVCVCKSKTFEPKGNTLGVKLHLDTHTHSDNQGRNLSLVEIC